MISDEERTANWNRYYERLESSPPRATLLRALELFDAEGVAPGRALDLGCGGGVDTRELLRRGWHVHAVDRELSAIERIRASVDPESLARLSTEVAAFEDLAITPARFINASYSLPFCHPDAFPRLWSQIRAALSEGGRFAGQLFGERDSWADSSHMTFHRREELDGLFEGFEIEDLKEVDEDGTTALGDPKHWHVFSVVARRL
jgi:tellurite methyltransferase